MMLLSKSSLLPLLLCLGLACSKDYHGHSVVQVGEITLDSQLAAIESTARRLRDDVLYWRHDPPAKGRDYGLLVSPAALADVLSALAAAGLEAAVALEDVGPFLDLERGRADGRAAEDCVVEGSGYDGSLTFDAYHSTETFYEYFDYLERTFDWVSTFSIGQSFEGRDMRILQVCKSGPCGSARHAMWVDAGIHAREWIAPATAMYMAQELVENDALHPDLTANLDWYILPVVNPDGYAFTRAADGDRFWRMTRRPNEGTDDGCVGADANRNWDFQWGPQGSSYDPCDPSQTYHGPFPFSEVEILNVATFLNTTAPQRGAGRVHYYMAIHSYLEAILLPWSYTSESIAWQQDLFALASPAAEAMRSIEGRDYVVDTIPNLVGATAGAANDWAIAGAAVKYAYGMELRGGPLPGLYGFVLPPEEICPNSREVFAFHQSAAQYIYQEFGAPQQ